MLLSLLACVLFASIFVANEKRKGGELSIKNALIIAAAPLLFEVALLTLLALFSWPEWLKFALTFGYLIIPALLIKLLLKRDWGTAAGYGFLMFLLVNAFHVTSRLVAAFGA